jgi:hypothetical protein
METLKQDFFVKIMVLCEEGSFEKLRLGFVQQAGVILERRGKNNFVVRKCRETHEIAPDRITKVGKENNGAGSLVIFSGFLEAAEYFSTTHDSIMVVFSDDELNISIRRYESSEMSGKIRDWYNEHRGFFLGKKFGL